MLYYVLYYTKYHRNTARNKNTADDPPLHQVRVENERPPDETDITKNRRYLNGSCYT